MAGSDPMRKNIAQMTPMAATIMAEIASLMLTKKLGTKLCKKLTIIVVINELRMISIRLLFCKKRTWAITKQTTKASLSDIINARVTLALVVSKKPYVAM